MVYIIFEPVSGSYPYNEKIVDISEKVIIGRATINSPSRQDNLYFSSQVLSRNHAIIFFDNNEKKVNNKIKIMKIDIFKR